MSELEETPQGVCPVLPYSEVTARGAAFSHYALFDEMREKSAFYRGDTADYWMFTRGDMIREALGTPDLFSNSSIIHLDPDPSFRWIPENLDPPEHTDWRHKLQPFFTPRAIATRAESIREICIRYIDELREKGKCEFVHDFAQIYPTAVFVQFLGLPASDTAQFIEWQDATIRAPSWDDQDAIQRVMGDILAYMGDLINERRRHPKDDDDLITMATKWEINGARASDEDLQSLLLLLFNAGLDTVATQLSFSFLHLATHPADRKRIASDPEAINMAVEEFVRFYAIVSPSRKVTRDEDFHGCPIKKGQMVWLPIWSGTRDGRSMEHADSVEFDREVNNHMGFGTGPHRCLGAHLARSEMRIALDEWHKRIPDYELDPEDEAVQRISAVMTLDRLPLIWPSQ
jgi:cytochrome P450